MRTLPDNRASKFSSAERTVGKAMIVLTDCLGEKTDEGCLKVANSLVRRIKEAAPGTKVVTYGQRRSNSDCHLKLNKLFLNRRLFQLLNREERVLYIPFSSNTKASVLRTWILSKLCRNKLSVLFVLRHQMDDLSKKLLQNSGARIIILSEASFSFFWENLKNDVLYLKTGVDTEKFRPVAPEKKVALRQKYGIAEQETVVLHVGHLKAGRNVGKLLDIPDTYRVILVASTLTKDECDGGLWQQLAEKPNITVMDTYLEHIEEIYQLADVYFFPVEQQGNCIDVPLSALEAAACNLPVVATPYGELKQLLGKDGFYEIKSFEMLNELIQKAKEENYPTREHILEYDWRFAVKQLLGGDGK